MADAPSTEAPKPTGVGRLLRSASFERKRRGSSTAQEERSTATSGPHGPHAVINSGTTESEASSSGGSNTESEWKDDGRPLRGWLQKRHARQATTQALQWAGRFFSVDDVRGTLSYSKGEKKKPSAILPLADVTEVKPLETGGNVGDSPWCFVISCPPVHFTVRAKDSDEREMWLQGLRSRSAKWKAKLSPVATAADVGLAKRSPDAHGGAEIDARRRTSHDATGDAGGMMSGGGGVGGDDWDSAAPPPYHNAEGGYEAAARHQSSGTVELESDDEDTKLTGREKVRLTRKALGLNSDEWAQYTEAEQAEFLELELWIESNKAAYDAVNADADSARKSDSGRRSADSGRKQRAQHDPTGAPRDLADMLSSDDELENDTLDDIAPVRAPPPDSSSRCAATLASSPPPPPAHELSREPFEPACCSAVPSEAGGLLGGYGAAAAPYAAAPYAAVPMPRVEAASAGPMAWLSALPDSAYDDADAVRDAELNAELDAHLGLEARPPRAADLAAPYEPAPYVPTPYAPAQYEPAPYESQLAPPLASEPYPVDRAASYPVHEAPYPVEPPRPPIGQTQWNSWDSNHGAGPAAEDDVLRAAEHAVQSHSTTDGHAIAVGAGIIADENFVDEDWDDD